MTAWTVNAQLLHDFGDVGQASVRSATAIADSTLIAVFDPGETFHLLSKGSTNTVIGRKGDGPGEFRDLAWITSDDTRDIIAVDAFRRVASKWTADGRLLSELRVDFPYLSGVWNTRAGIVLRAHNQSQTAIEFFHVDFEREQVRSWRRLPMRDSVYEVCRYCFSAVSADGRIAVSAPDTLYRVYRWNADGTFDGFFTRDNVPLVEFTDAEKDSVVQMRLKAGREAVAGGLTVSDADELIRSLPSPRWKPRFSVHGIFWDRSGVITVQPNVTQGSTARLDVFSAQGQYCGAIHLGTSRRVLEVQLPRIVVVTYSADGGESLGIMSAVTPAC